MRAQRDLQERRPVAPGRVGPTVRWAGAALITCSLAAAVAGPALAAGRTAAPVQRYVVRPGDTLSAIAARSGYSVQAIARRNSISNPNLIVAGRTLVMPTEVGRSGATTSAVRRTSAPQEALVVADVGRHPRRLSGRRLRLMPVFDHWAAHYGMRSDLLKALCYLESGWHAHAVSSTGAVGIGQLMPETATFMRRLIGLPVNRWNTNDNIHMSAKYLRWLLDQTGWNVRTAVGSYYQGLQAMRAHGAYPGTVTYVNAVLALQTRF